MNRFILASASPRRRELLSGMGIKFDVVVSDADESTVSKEQEPGTVCSGACAYKSGGVRKKSTQ